MAGPLTLLIAPLLEQQQQQRPAAAATAVPQKSTNGPEPLVDYYYHHHHHPDDDGADSTSSSSFGDYDDDDLLLENEAHWQEDTHHPKSTFFHQVLPNVVLVLDPAKSHATPQSSHLIEQILHPRRQQGRRKRSAFWVGPRVGADWKQVCWTAPSSSSTSSSTTTSTTPSSRDAPPAAPASSSSSSPRGLSCQQLQTARWGEGAGTVLSDHPTNHKHHEHDEEEEREERTTPTDSKRCTAISPPRRQDSDRSYGSVSSFAGDNNNNTKSSKNNNTNNNHNNNNNDSLQSLLWQGRIASESREPGHSSRQDDDPASPPIHGSNSNTSRTEPASEEVASIQSMISEEDTLSLDSHDLFMIQGDFSSNFDDEEDDDDDQDQRLLHEEILDMDTALEQISSQQKQRRHLRSSRPQLRPDPSAATATAAAAAAGNHHHHHDNKTAASTTTHRAAAAPPPRPRAAGLLELSLFDDPGLDDDFDDFDESSILLSGHSVNSLYADDLLDDDDAHSVLAP